MNTTIVTYGGNGLICLGLLLASGFGCTAESTRIALQMQHRADQLQQAVFERQNESLRILLFRDALRRMQAAGEPLNPQQRAALNAVWNERDLLEFWHVQHERAGALRRIGVDAKLFGDQAPLDLLLKSLEAKFDRVRAAAAAQAGAALPIPPGPPTAATSAALPPPAESGGAAPRPARRNEPAGDVDVPQSDAGEIMYPVIVIDPPAGGGDEPE